MNSAVIWGTEVAASVLDVEPVKAIFRSVSYNVILDELQAGMVLFATEYREQSQQLTIVDNFNSSQYIRDILQSEVVPCLQRLHVALYQMLVHILLRMGKPSLQNNRFSLSLTYRLAGYVAYRTCLEFVLVGFSLMASSCS